MVDPLVVGWAVDSVGCSVACLAARKAERSVGDWAAQKVAWTAGLLARCWVVVLEHRWVAMTAAWRD